MNLTYTHTSADPQLLDNRVRALGLPGFEGVIRSDINLTVVFTDDLDAGQIAQVDAVVPTHHIEIQSETDARLLLELGQFEAVHRVDTVTAGRLTKVEWFESYAAGVGTGKAEQTVYTWSGNRLMSSVRTQYRKDGVACSTDTTNYVTESDGRRVEIKT